MAEAITKIAAMSQKGVLGNFNQKKYPVNPVSYVNNLGVTSIHRFILTHPDMDHMDGIETFFNEFSPVNFWDTDNREVKEFGTGFNGGYNEDDWKFYVRLRDNGQAENPKRLVIYTGQSGQFWNEGKDGELGDGIHVIAPTPGLLQDAHNRDDYNDCSYVLLYRTNGYRILFAGDSHDSTWNYILENHELDVTDIDLLVAPHHGRDSGRSFGFLDIVNPTLTLFGNAESEFLAYSAWNSRGLPKITNNQAGCVIVDAGTTPMSVFVSCESFAKASNPYTFSSTKHDGFYYYGNIEAKRKRKSASM